MVHDKKNEPNELINERSDRCMSHIIHIHYSKRPVCEPNQFSPKGIWGHSYSHGKLCHSMLFIRIDSEVICGRL